MYQNLFNNHNKIQQTHQIFYCNLTRLFVLIVFTSIYPPYKINIPFEIYKNLTTTRINHDIFIEENHLRF